jgi:hypothetical protein
MIRMPTRVLPLVAGLLLTLAALPPLQAQEAGTPRQAIEQLDLEVRRLLHKDKPARTPEQAEQAVADAITALAKTSPGHLSLTDADERGRTPLMLAARGPYPRVVQALLADPAVKLRINQPDADGITAWMHASFAPALTLPACEPGALTRQRYALLPPYLRRMAHLLQTRAEPLRLTLEQLQQAGADTDGEAAKQAWLERCPNATPALREALAGGELMRTLVQASTRALSEFNETARKDVNLLPDKPPAGMKFVRGDRDRHGQPLPALDIEKMTCELMPRPERPGPLHWSGRYVVRLFARTRAGVIEAVDLEPETRMRGKHDAGVAAYLDHLILSALAGYECKGDKAFEQTFEFSIR